MTAEVTANADTPNTDMDSANADYPRELPDTTADAAATPTKEMT